MMFLGYDALPSHFCESSFNPTNILASVGADVRIAHNFSIYSGSESLHRSMLSQVGPQETATYGSLVSLDPPAESKVLSHSENVLQPLISFLGVLCYHSIKV